ncbi:MAG: protein-L-isoaspartate(D-aspartate) O-methyltransferase [Candidatus Berkiella sp.]
MTQQSELIKTLIEQGITHPKVLDALMAIPRDTFVSSHLKSRAYANVALSIDCAQTISQPYIVALMTQAIMQHPAPQKILEIGTGSGYQTAILASLFPEVWTIERIPELFYSAQERLNQLDFSNIHFKLGDGTQGWSDAAPFDAIIVTAATIHVPPALLTQLSPAGGLMVIPLGPTGEVQILTLLEKRDDRVEKHFLEQVAFVPLIANHD